MNNRVNNQQHKIILDDILVKHLVLFKYNTSNAVAFIYPHHFFKIEDSIHYTCLIHSDFENYTSLLNTTTQPEHSLKKYSELINSFDIQKLSTNKIKLEWVETLKKYVVLDGCHRLAIIKYYGLDDSGYLSKKYFDVLNK